jgi:hypothetical protein
MSKYADKKKIERGRAGAFQYNPFSYSIAPSGDCILHFASQGAIFLAIFGKLRILRPLEHYIRACFDWSHRHDFYKRLDD